MENWGKLIHLFVTVFLSTFAEMMIGPALPDVTLAAVCPGEEECSTAIYLTGVQQAVVNSILHFTVSFNSRFCFWLFKLLRIEEFE